MSEAADKSALFRCLGSDPPDLVTLDLGLPDGDGLLLAREIRTRRNLPIFMITGRDTPEDRVLGLEHGADDYIVKPFHIREVVLRIHAAVSRYGQPLQKAPADVVTPERYVFDGGTLDVDKRLMRGTDGAVIALTDLEQALLTLFLRNSQRVLTRDEITQAVHGRKWSPTDRALDVHITRLRKKIQPGLEFRLIKSVRNVGYVFTGDVRRL